MDDSELEALLLDLESDRVERKSSLTAGDNKEKICQAICAFANDLPDHRVPGVLFVGATDSGDCADLPIADQLLQNLADLRSNGNIHPFPTMAVQKRTLRGCELAVIVVEPSDAPPVRYKGRTWIRVGPRRTVATLEEERRLTEKRRSKDLPYDLHTLSSAVLGDLDYSLFERTYLPASLPVGVVEANQRTTDQQLTSMRFVSIEQPPRPTVLGILVAGKDPRQLLPCAYIQFLRIRGTELTDPIQDQDEIDGPLPDLLRTLDAKLRAHISVAANFTSQAVETRLPDFPIVALQQLTRNAVMHRTYEATNAPVRITWFEDRVEIQNPGGPFGQVTADNLGKPGFTDYRNPHLAEAMKNLGYVQRFGVGIPMARDALRKNGNPEPEFQAEEANVLVIVRRRP